MEREILTKRSVEDIEESFYNYLESLEIYPANVTFTRDYNETLLLSITTPLKEDLDQILDILDYNSFCDKKCFVVVKEYDTLILYGMALTNFLVKVGL